MKKLSIIGGLNFAFNSLYRYKMQDNLQNGISCKIFDGYLTNSHGLTFNAADSFKPFKSDMLLVSISPRSILLIHCGGTPISFASCDCVKPACLRKNATLLKILFCKMLPPWAAFWSVSNKDLQHILYTNFG